MESAETVPMIENRNDIFRTVILVNSSMWNAEFTPVNKHNMPQVPSILSVQSFSFNFMLRIVLEIFTFRLCYFICKCMLFHFVY
jgi:hypothetical protein